MKRKINPFIITLLMIVFVATLHQAGLSDLFSDVKETETSCETQVKQTAEASTAPATETSSAPAAKEKHMHKAVKTKKKNKVAATCTKKGGYDKVKYCSCGKEMSRKHITLKKLGHKYKSGVCTVCKAKDPNYVKVWSGKEIINTLDQSVVTSTGGFSTHTGNDCMSVFAEDQSNCFSFHTLVSYNLWGHNEQYAVFNVKELNKMKNLWMSIGGETGGKGKATVDIYLDKTMDEDPDATYEVDMADTPKRIKVKLKGVTSLGIRVTNHASNENRVVFFNLSSKE